MLKKYVVELKTATGEWQNGYGDFIEAESPQEAASLFMDWQREQIIENINLFDDLNLEEELAKADNELYRVLLDTNVVEIFVGNEF